MRNLGRLNSRYFQSSIAKASFMKNFQTIGRKSRLLAMFCFVIMYSVMIAPSVAGGGHILGMTAEYELDEININERNDIIIQKQVVQAEKRRFDDLIQNKSSEYGVSFEQMSQIIDCENTERDPLLQSRVLYTQAQISRHSDWGEVGEREKSFGLVQIHIPACNKWNGKCITKKQAQNPEFAVNYLAHELSNGRGSKWSCYS